MEIRSGKRPESNSAVTVRRTAHPNIVRRAQPHPPFIHFTKMHEPHESGYRNRAGAVPFQSSHTEIYEPNAHPMSSRSFPTI
ncbi:hypothetical protein M404DRAFT_996232 [Pisolithus tinctorius Marx 270]|uniref:Uncharacterized protein n=1 Tax=Pisolithus tinctorius Marx 270 TaxID=870435 RepID=A0A0C3KIK2_PISTI|nr:hypothetical protein M404DRAFT_996232 [Pisolithus tinctorius Marx 270]